MIILGYNGNKYVGQPQSISTRPLIVSPNMVPSSSGDHLPGVVTQGVPGHDLDLDLVSSYSDRYGWSDKSDYNRYNNNNNNYRNELCQQLF